MSSNGTAVAAPMDPNWSPSSHLAELAKLSKRGTLSQSFLQHAKQSVPLSMYAFPPLSTQAELTEALLPARRLRFILKTVQQYITLLVLSPSTVFSDPLGSLAMFIIYPFVIVGLLLFTVSCPHSARSPRPSPHAADADHASCEARLLGHVTPRRFVHAQMLHL